MTYFDARDELRKAVASRGEPAPASPEDSVRYRLMQDYERSSERIERIRTEIANREKMRTLNAKLDSGELDTADPVRRWYHGLAPGERHGDRELAGLDAQAQRWAQDAEAGRDGGGGNLDGKLASILTDRLYPGGDDPDTPRGNITGADALAELGISVWHGWKAS